MELKDISILNLMPPNLAEDRNIKMIAEAFDEVLREIIKKIPGIAVIPNLVLNQIVSETLIDLLAWQFHVDFYEPDMPLETKRELVLKSLDWHYRKGTPSVVEDIVSTVFSKALVQEWHEYGGLPHRFRIATDEQMPDEATRNKLYRAINSVKNTRSFLDALIQLVYFADKVEMNEQPLMEMRTKTFTDNFGTAGRLLHNGRILRDGKTVLKTETKKLSVFRDGTYTRDDSIIRGENRRRFPTDDKLFPPFLRNTWDMERLLLTFDFGKYEEQYFAQALRNGYNHRNSGMTRNGLSNTSVNERVDILRFGMAATEELKASEQSNVAVGLEMTDTLPRKRNNTFRRDGKTYRNNGMADAQRLNLDFDALQDTASGTLLRNGSFRRNTAERRSGGKHIAYEIFKIWMRKHHFHNGVYTRNGQIKRDSMILIPLE